MKNIILSPSILAADFTSLSSSIEKISVLGGSWVHIDVMDGSFVPNISFGQPVVTALRPLTKLPFDVHLMIDFPERHIDSFAHSGADYITFHVENTIHHHRLIQQIRAAGVKPGISIVPSTPISALEEILPYVDLVLVMTVNPGFGGQELIEGCVEKITRLCTIRREKGYTWLVSVDGGVNEKTVQSVIDAGADVIVSGSAFFSGKLPLERILK